MITDVLPMTRKDLAQTSFKTSVNFTLSTQCYTKGPYKGGNLHTNLRCCFKHPAMLHPLFGGESVPSMMCLHICNQTIKISTLLYIIHVTKTGFTLSLTALSATPKANSTTAA